MSRLKENRSAEYIVETGEGEHLARLCVNQWRDLQEILGVGPAVLYDRFINRAFLIDDIIEVLRVGLTGGGMDHIKAKQLVNRVVRGGYIMDYAGVALDILHAGIMGASSEPVGEPDAANEPTTDQTPTD